jgi:uncharacterized protein YdhG (YjbR/CyaY superfamily)
MSPIDEYLDTLGASERAALERIRTIIHETVPGAEEVISYGMPGFKVKKKYLGGFYAFKKHLSFFPTGGPIEALEDKLTGFKISKGTIQFTVESPIPEPLIIELVLCRLADIDKS